MATEKSSVRTAVFYIMPHAKIYANEKNKLLLPTHVVSAV